MRLLILALFLTACGSNEAPSTTVYLTSKDCDYLGLRKGPKGKPSATPSPGPSPSPSVIVICGGEE